MATSNHLYGPTETARPVVKRCDECGMAHRDANYQTCRDCGACLE